MVVHKKVPNKQQKSPPAKKSHNNPKKQHPQNLGM